MRRSFPLLILALAVVAPLPALAAAPSQGPVVDVVEIAGLIDRPVSRYALERIAEAEREHDALLVFQVDSLGGVKVSDELVRRIAGAHIPIAVHIGPRGARGAGLVTRMAAAADVSSIGPSARLGLTGHKIYGANEAKNAGLVDLVVPSVAVLLQQINGRTVQTAAGPVTLDLPSGQTVVRFFQPGPIRRLLHAFANPALVYLTLLCAVMLLVFELFQPGFGVAGWSGGLLAVGAIYGLTVLPVRWPGLLALLLGLGLMTLDVARDELLVPTIAGTAGMIVGSILLLPGAEPSRLSPWLIGWTIAGALVFFIPTMTLVRRARRPIATSVKAQLVGERGDVRSVLNPEGFVMVDGEIWRARTEDGRRMRVGEEVVVASIDGTVLIVRPQPVTNGASQH